MKKKAFSSLKNLIFVAPCQWMIQPLSASFMKNFPARVIPNGVNLDVFKPVTSDLRKRYQLESKKVCLSVAAEWDERKGLKFILEASEKLGAEYIFVVIGLEKKQMTSLPSNILPLEKTADTNELAAWYSTADCLVNPTLEDNMPMVNLESLACGTPVVVFKTGGCPEAVTNECGAVVPQGDIDLFCSEIRRVSAKKAQMKKACLDRALLFDCRNTFQAYLELYKELCK